MKKREGSRQRCSARTPNTAGETPALPVREMNQRQLFLPMGSKPSILLSAAGSAGPVGAWLSGVERAGVFGEDAEHCGRDARAPRSEMN